MSDEAPETVDAAPLETAPESISVSLRGFAEPDQATRFGNLIADIVRSMSKYIDLTQLDGITVAYDYDEALAQVDRGFDARRPLRRTADGYNVGVAMAPAVLRNGVVKAHLVFFAPAVLPLEDQSSPGFRDALYLVAHECAHVEDLRHRDACFPGTILQREIVDCEEAILDPAARVLWEEYAACRASAVFGEEQGAVLEESFASVLPTARGRVNAAILSYRVHADIERVLHEAGSPLCEPLRLAAYLLGHLDGRDQDMDTVPRARDLLVGSQYESFVERLHGVLRGLWSRRGLWSSPAEFDPLKDIVRELFADGGMILQRRPDGSLYVAIPFTTETTPR